VALIRQHAYAGQHTTFGSPVVRFQAAVTKANGKALRRALLRTAVCTAIEGRRFGR